MIGTGEVHSAPTVHKSSQYCGRKNHIVTARAVPIPGICISIGPIPAFFDGIRIGQVCCTSTNSVVCVLFNFFQNYQAKITKTKLILTAHSIMFPCIGIGTCTCEYI